MKSQPLKLDSGLVLYDAERFARANLAPNLDWFRPHFWEDEGLVAARQRGRGTALFVKTPVGRAVLRQYLRGGVAARFIRERYLFKGVSRSRPVREYRVLERLAELGLPAPPPLAALCERHGLAYTGAILTLEIENVRTIEQQLHQMDADAWTAVGQCIRRFHRYGLVHADLTVRNILIQEGGAVHLVDFDRARFGGGALAFRANLSRLQRSLRKAWPDNQLEEDESAWTHLLKGYES